MDRTPKPTNPGFSAVKQAIKEIEKESNYHSGLVVERGENRSALVLRVYFENGDQAEVPWSLFIRSMLTLDRQDANEALLHIFFSKSAFLVKGDRGTLTAAMDAMEDYRLKRIYSKARSESTGIGIDYVRLLMEEEEGGGGGDRESASPETDELLTIASNPNTPDEVLSKLADHADAKVRHAVAGNKATMGETLAKLMTDSDAAVRKYAVGNKNVTAAQLAAAMDAIARREAAKKKDSYED